MSTGEYSVNVMGKLSEKKSSMVIETQWQFWCCGPWGPFLPNATKTKSFRSAIKFAWRVIGILQVSIKYNMTLLEAIVLFTLEKKKLWPRLYPRSPVGFLVPVPDDITDLSVIQKKFSPGVFFDAGAYEIC